MFHFDLWFSQCVPTISLYMTSTDHTGVPMATQWDKTGYFYAISIAQFGLSHHAKFLLDDTPTSKVCVICRGHNHMNTPFAHSCLDISLRSLKLINTRQHNLMAQLQIYPLTVVCLFALLSFYNIQICCLIIWTNMYFYTQR